MGVEKVYRQRQIYSVSQRARPRENRDECDEEETCTANPVVVRVSDVVIPKLYFADSLAEENSSVVSYLITSR